MEFHVGDFDKTYGTPQPGHTTKIYYFSSENRLVSLAASESFTGLMSVTLGSLNKECVILDKKQEAEAAAYDEALNKDQGDTWDKSSDNFRTTVIISSVMLICMLLLTGLFCIFTVKDIKKRISQALLTDDEKLFGNIQKFANGFDALLATAKEAKKGNFMVIEDIVNAAGKD